MTLQEISRRVAKQYLAMHEDLDVDLAYLQAVCDNAADLYLQTDTCMSDEAFITLRLNIAVAVARQQRELLSPSTDAIQINENTQDANQKTSIEKGGTDMPIDCSAGSKRYDDEMWNNVLADLKAGLDKDGICTKYNISASTLDYHLTKWYRAGELKRKKAPKVPKEASKLANEPCSLDYVSAHLDISAFLHDLLSDAKVLEVTGSNARTCADITYLTANNKKIHIQINESEPEADQDKE